MPNPALAGNPAQLMGDPICLGESDPWTYQRLLVFGYVNIHSQADGTYDGDFNYERF